MSVISSTRPNRAPSRPMASHARLHKRGNSSSSIPEAITSPPSRRPSLPFSPMSSPPCPEDDSQGMRSPDAFSLSGEKLGMSPETSTPKIKPYLKKFASKEDTSMQIDLSKSAAETEGPAGLGISDLGGYSRSSDVSGPSQRRHHARTTSNTSQPSISSSHAYVHPLRRTPRPYTPPFSQSFSNSAANSSEESQVATAGLSEAEFGNPPPFLNPQSRRSTSSNSTPRPSPLLRMQTSESKRSQSSLHNTLPPASLRRDTLRSLDGQGTGGRSSVDRATSFLRSNTDPVGPDSRAAQIENLRRAYREKQQMKEDRARKMDQKKSEKENRRRYKQEEAMNHQLESNISTHNLTATDGINEKTGAGPTNATPRVSTKRAAISPWIRFTTWFRTRIHKLSRKLKLS